jgi:ketosteroid isomerase-like protein
MGSQSPEAAVLAAVERINQSWLESRPQDLYPLLHPDVKFVYPEFSGRAEGRDAIIAGFTDFCENVIVHDFRESDHEADIIADTAVASFKYQMIYERAGEKSVATGRDLWVFARKGDAWLAVWRTMLDLAERPA